MRVFISTGEPSGDLHAANLARALQARNPGIDLVGFGGPHFQATGARVLYPLTNLAVMWIGQAIAHLFTFIRLVRRADALFERERPDAVVLIDYPGFHFALAKRASRRGIRVIWFVPPQLWGWAGWRVEKVKRWVTHVLCTLPFERGWYQKRGYEKATYVGHPYFDELHERHLDEEFMTLQLVRNGRLIAILPGSRTKEIKQNLPIQLRAAAKLSRELPDTRFVITCLRETHAALAREILANAGHEIPRIEIHTGRTAELIHIADLAWAVSGSVGLELMHELLPTVVLYKLNWFGALATRLLLKAPYVGIVNLLAGEEVMPEFLTRRDCSNELVAWATRWLSEPAAHRAVQDRLRRVRDTHARPGATELAAEEILRLIAQHTQSQAPQPGPRAPHIRPSRKGVGESSPRRSVS
jgi:lipid-A-disaccharide synthase